MNSIGEDGHENGSEDVPPEREVASLIAMLWFIGDRVRGLGYSKSARLIDEARDAFARETTAGE